LSFRPAGTEVVSSSVHAIQSPYSRTTRIRGRLFLDDLQWLDSATLDLLE